MEGYTELCGVVECGAGVQRVVQVLVGYAGS